MTDTNQAPVPYWTVKQAIILAVICLVAGIAGGWSIRSLQSPAVKGPANASVVPQPAEPVANPAAQAPSPAQLREMADTQAAPILDKLKADPNNPDLLTSIGNLYYDAQQYPAAIDYYERTLKARPDDVAVRTDMGTAYWFMGNADSALAAFNKALSYAPNNANTLFNRGLVKFKGKADPAGAIADWQQLLKANPKYEGKDKVEEMMAEARKQAAAKPGTTPK